MALWRCRRVVPAFTLGTFDLWALSGRTDEGLFDSLCHNVGIDADFSAEQSLHALGFAPSEMALGPLGSEHLSFGGDVKAFLRAFVGFQFWHCSIMQYAPVRVTHGRVYSMLAGRFRSGML